VTTGVEACASAGVAGVAPVGEHADREVAVGDEADGGSVAVDEDDRADVALAHHLGDRAHRAAGRRGDDRLRHDLADLHPGFESYTSARMAQPSPTQQAWRHRVEAALGVVAPALDLMLAAGDRLSRAVERDDLDWVPPRRALGGGQRPPAGDPETPRS
jgi:hypothetical protein